MLLQSCPQKKKNSIEKDRRAQSRKHTLHALYTISNQQHIYMTLASRSSSQHATVIALERTDGQCFKMTKCRFVPMPPVNHSILEGVADSMTIYAMMMDLADDDLERDKLLPLKVMGAQLPSACKSEEDSNHPNVRVCTTPEG